MQPPIHKPFAAAGLGELLKKVTAEPPKQAPKQSIPPMPPQHATPAPAPVPAATAPMPPEAPAVKPISLSSLAPRPNSAAPYIPKSDPKAQTPQNVNALKAALEAAMKGKSAPVPTPTPTSAPAPAPAVQPQQQPEAQKGPVISQQDVQKPNITLVADSKPVAQITPESKQAAEKKPDEVPREVLEKVLKVDGENL